MAYNARAPQGGKKNPTKGGHKKLGGPSVKHRGYKPETDAGRSGKKPRWSSEQRVANGLGAERPRGQRPERGDERPNWEPRGKDARASVERAPAARKRDGGYGRDRDDRGSERSYGDRPRRDDRPYNDRPARDDRPRTERFAREDDAPRREGYRGRDGASSSRTNHGGDRPHRLAGKGQGREHRAGGGLGHAVALPGHAGDLQGHAHRRASSALRILGET